MSNLTSTMEARQVEFLNSRCITNTHTRPASFHSLKLPHLTLTKFNESYPLVTKYLKRKTPNRIKIMQNIVVFPCLANQVELESRAGNG